MRGRTWRALWGIALALSATTVPLTVASACSCGFAGFPEAIGASDWAFVGTVVGAEEPGQPDGMGTATYAFEVEGSKAPMETPFSVESMFGNGANCGFDMAVGERWLIIASVHEGRPTTNLCSGSTPMEALDPETAALVQETLTSQPAPNSSEGSASGVPVPVVLVALGTLVLAVGSWIAFRRPSPS